VESFDALSSEADPARMSKSQDGVSALCVALREMGVDIVFGIPGTQNIELFDGFRRADIRTVLSTHELAAAFMANGYFRASGRVAALATIPGPGFMYALTGLAEARLDSAAVLFLVGAPAKVPGRQFQLQRLEQRAIAGPLVKGILTLTQPDEAASVVREAHHLATTGEPGPVMIELALASLAGDIRSPKTFVAPERVRNAAQIAELGRVFASAERPVFFLGQGAFDAGTELVTLSERLRIPVVTTPAGRGIIAETHQLSMPFDPLRGNLDAVNELFDSADLVVAMGCKLGHNGTAGFQLRLDRDRLVHLDAEPGTAGANYDARLCMTGRVDDVLVALAARTAPSGWDAHTLRLMRERIRRPPASAEPRYEGEGEDTTTAQAFFSWLRSALPADAVVVTDSGLHQILTRRHFDVLAPRGLIVPNDLQSMGYGLPAAIGAKLGAPERCVVAIIGDGGFLMSGLELLTARRESVAVTTIVFNDGRLNQIRLQQLANSGRPYAVDLLNPDFESLAEALGVKYVRFGVDPRNRVEDALRLEQPALIEVRVGDSFEIKRLAATSRAKSMARTALGSRARGWLKAVLHRR
jgi:acetolactate synthase-1/2/3 large subunit